ncbi:hypothetical protein V8E36_004699 [Tilletia maclaganii]
MGRSHACMQASAGIQRQGGPPSRYCNVDHRSTAAYTRAGMTTKGQPAPTETVPDLLGQSASDAPLLGADWLMPLRYSSSSALVTAPVPASEADQDLAHDAIAESAFPPAVPAKRASVATALPRAQVKPVAISTALEGHDADLCLQPMPSEQ